MRKQVIFITVFLIFSISGFGQKSNWQGTWTSTYGELRLVEQGELIFGDYANVGVIYGSRIYDSSGNERFSGTFENYLSNKKGVINFKIDNPKFNNTFTGKWSWKTPVKWTSWKGKKISKKTPALKSFFAVKGRIIDKSTNKDISENVEVQVFRDGIRRFITFSKQGKYEQLLPKGTWEIRVNHRGYRPYKARIIINKQYPSGRNYYTANIILEKRNKKGISRIKK